MAFDIDVTNTGNRPLQNVYLNATGDSGMMDERGGRGVQNPKDDGPLQPGETWGARVAFTPTNSGRRCIRVEAFADGGQRSQQESCVTAINPIPRTPTLEALLEGRDQVATGQTALLRAKVGNTGTATAKNVKIDMVFDPQLQLSRATEGADQSRIGQNMITWTVPSIEPGQTKVLEGEFNLIRPNPRARVMLSAKAAKASPRIPTSCSRSSMARRRRVPCRLRSYRRPGRLLKYPVVRHRDHFKAPGKSDANAACRTTTIEPIAGTPVRSRHLGSCERPDSILAANRQ